MPLLRTPGEPKLDEARNMLGFWMREAGAFGPVEGVRVFVTIDALWTMQPGCERNRASVFDIFSRRRGRVELAASNRFDDPSGRTEAEELYEGRPVVVITTYDLRNIPVEWDYEGGRPA